jgi:hypothetical protein
MLMKLLPKRRNSLKLFSCVTALAVLFTSAAIISNAQQAPVSTPAAAPAAQQPAPTPYPDGWTGKEFNKLPPMIDEAESFINQTCQPASLDHIQIMNMQHGHDQPINIHVYCKQDKAASAQYKLSLVPVVGRRLGGALNPLLAKPNSRIVGFYFGKTGEDDDIMLLEKIK